MLKIGTEGQGGWPDVIAPAHAAVPFVCARVSDSWPTTGDAIAQHAALGVDVLLLIETWNTPTATIVSTVQRYRPTVTAVELGNEDSYANKNGSDVPTMRAKAASYALAVKALRQALDAAGLTSVKVVAQNDNALWSGSAWVDAMYGAVPDLHKWANVWTLHPYTAGQEVSRILRQVAQAARWGCPISFPVWLTEYGISSGNGATLDDNNGWPLDLTYAQAATNLTSVISQIATVCPMVERLYWFGMIDAGTDPTKKEQNFGYLTRDIRPKAFIPPALAAMVSYKPPANAGLVPWVGDWFAGTAGTAATASCRAPPRAVGERLAAFLYVYSTTAVPAAAGWTLTRRSVSSTFQICTFERTADGTSADDFSASWTGSVYSHAAVARILGVSGTTLVGVDNTARSTSPITRTVTTSKPRHLLLAAMSTDSGTSSRPPTGFTTQDLGNNAGVSVASNTILDPGASGDQTWTLTTADIWLTHMLAIPPAAFASNAGFTAGFPRTLEGLLLLEQGTVVDEVGGIPLTASGAIAVSTTAPDRISAGFARTGRALSIAVDASGTWSAGFLRTDTFALCVTSTGTLTPVAGFQRDTTGRLGAAIT